MDEQQGQLPQPKENSRFFARVVVIWLVGLAIGAAVGGLTTVALLQAGVDSAGTISGEDGGR